MSFDRLGRWHWLAGVAALALMLAMASDWYGTKQSDSLRRDQGLVDTDGETSGQPGRVLEREIPPVAELGEQNAWQAYWAPDPGILVLLLLLGAVAAGLGVAYGRAAETKVTLMGAGPSRIAVIVGLLAIVAVILRLVDQPGADEATTVRGGAFLGLLALSLMVLGAAQAMKEDERAALDRPSTEGHPAQAGPGAPERAPATPRVR